MPAQIFALVWAKDFFESMPLPPIGNDPRLPQPKQFVLAAGEKSLFTDLAEAEKHRDHMNADYPHLNDHPVDIAIMPVQ